MKVQNSSKWRSSLFTGNRRCTLPTSVIERAVIESTENCYHGGHGDPKETFKPTLIYLPEDKKKSFPEADLIGGSINAQGMQITLQPTFIVALLILHIACIKGDLQTIVAEPPSIIEGDELAHTSTAGTGVVWKHPLIEIRRVNSTIITSHSSPLAVLLALEPEPVLIDVFAASASRPAIIVTLDSTLEP